MWTLAVASGSWTWLADLLPLLGWTAAVVPVVTAAAGAYSSKSSAKSANKPRKNETRGTITNSPWAPTEDYAKWALQQGFLNFFNPPEFPGTPPPAFHFDSSLIDRLRGFGARISRAGGGDLRASSDWAKNILSSTAAQNPYLQDLSDSFQRDAQESYEDVRPRLLTPYNLGGHFASSLREQAIQTGANEFSEDLQGTLAGLRSQAFSDYLGAQQGAAGVLSNNAGIAVQRAAAAASVASQAAQLGLQVAGMKYNAALQRWEYQFAKEQYEENLPNLQLENFMKILLPIASLGGTQTQEGYNLQPGAGVSETGALIQGALAGYGAGGGGGGGQKTGSVPQTQSNPQFGFQPQYSV